MANHCSDVPVCRAITRECRFAHLYDLTARTGDRFCKGRISSRSQSLGLAKIGTKRTPKEWIPQMAFRETRASDMAHKIRQCPFCGLQVLRTATQCPSCREALPGAEGSAQHAPVRASQPRQRSLVRRGLLYMLLAAVIQYFSGGYSAMHIPVVVSSFVTSYLSPLLFLSGLGLTFYGLFGPRNKRLTAAHQ